MSHLLFNLFGCLIWFIFPFSRRVPINLARYAAEMTRCYRWWAISYIIIVFIICPLFIFLISILSNLALTILIGSGGIIFVILTFLNWYNWLPKWMISLEPIDRTICARMSWCNHQPSTRHDGIKNAAFSKV